MRVRSKFVAVAVATAALVASPAVAANATGPVSPYCQSANGGSTSFTKDLQCRLQEGPASHVTPNTYTGPVDGVMGVNSWKGVQRFLQLYYGYTGPIDGAPGTNTYKALQRWGADSSHGGTYTGPIDGVMGTNSWTGVDHALTYDYYSPAVRL